MKVFVLLMFSATLHAFSIEACKDETARLYARCVFDGSTSTAYCERAYRRTLRACAELKLFEIIKNKEPIWIIPRESNDENQKTE